MTDNKTPSRFKARLLGFKSKYFSAEPYKENEAQTKKLICTFVVLAIIFGSIFIMVNPPFTMPDENAHYVNICRIIEGGFFPDVLNGDAGSYITADQNAFISMFYGKYDGISGEKASFWDLYFQENLKFTNDELIFYPTRLSTINPLAYIVQSSGAGLASNILGIKNPSTILMFARFSSLLFYIAISALAIKKTPVLKRTMLLVALMPMAIYQGASISYDTILIPACFLLFAYAMKLYFSNEDYRVSIEDMVAICFACACIFSVKIAYAPLILIFLAVSLKKFGSLKRFFFCIGLVGATAVTFYLVPTLICKIITRGCANLQYDVLNQQKEFFASNPFIIFRVIHNTVSNDETREFWWKGFFGILGNLDTHFPNLFIGLYYFIIGSTALLELSTIKGFDWKGRLTAIGGPVIFFVGTITSMYLTWTPYIYGVGGDVSTGTQGRYFIPVALFCMMLVANPLLRRFKHMDKTMAVSTEVTRLTCTLYMILMLVVLILRFWVGSPAAA